MICHELFCRFVCLDPGTGPPVGPWQLGSCCFPGLVTLGPPQPGRRQTPPRMDHLDVCRHGAYVADTAGALAAMAGERLVGLCLERGGPVCHAGFSPVQPLFHRHSQCTGRWQRRHRPRVAGRMASGGCQRTAAQRNRSPCDRVFSARRAPPCVWRSRLVFSAGRFGVRTGRCGALPHE